MSLLFQEWDGFLKELHDAIQQQLTQSHVQYFSDLSEPEKELFMERATQAIKGGNALNLIAIKYYSWFLNFFF